jgi:hypothetical protein
VSHQPCGGRNPTLPQGVFACDELEYAVWAFDSSGGLSPWSRSWPQRRCRAQHRPPSASGGSPAQPPAMDAASEPTRSLVDSREPVARGTPIDVASLTGRIVLSSEDDLFHGECRRHGRSPTHTETRSRARPGMVAGRGEDRLPELAARPQPRRRDLRQGREEPHEKPGGRLGAGLVPRRPDDRVQLRSRRAADGRFLMDPEGSHLRRIRTDAYVEYPAWSPDGTRIAFMGGTSASEYDIWVVDTDGSNVTRLTDSPGPDGWPAWSPDGTRVAFSSVRDDATARMLRTARPPATSGRITTSGSSTRADKD